MGRSKQWWSRLESWERSKLVQLERADKHTYSGGEYLPDGMVECGFCGTPHTGYGICPYCSNNLQELINKANGNRISTET